MRTLSVKFTSDLSVGPESSEPSEEEKFLGTREDKTTGRDREPASK